MQSCLGLYIQDNLIKYAKITKERNDVRLEAYGVKFYTTDLESTINGIIQETASYQIPISVNIDKEKYAYSNVFGLLKPRDMENAIDTEFDVYCNANKKNKNALEYRGIKTVNIKDRDKQRVIYVYVDKANIVERVQLLDEYRVKNISPISLAIPNLNLPLMQSNCMVVNIEQDTTVTTMLNGEVYSVEKFDVGMKRILESIALLENSQQKAYEICKNATVYARTNQATSVDGMDGNEYIDEIISTLTEIIEHVRALVMESDITINNIYLTGMGIVINNIDLLFQDSFIDKKCEILMPSFVEKTSVKVNIKDYIEVNSAIALALQEILSKDDNKNFNIKSNPMDNTKKILNMKFKNNASVSKKPKRSLKDELNAELDGVEKMLFRGIAALLIFIMLYIGITEWISKQIKEKMNETEATIQTSNNEIAKIDAYSEQVEGRTKTYSELIKKIEEENAKISANYSSKNAIPNFLNQVMYNIPVGVQILSISNSNDKMITILAQSSKYDQLGYFKAALEEEGILVNITSTPGVKNGDMVSITITGELPY